MRKTTLLLVLTALAAGWSPASLADGSWERIDAPNHFVDRDGKDRFPACSGGPVPGAHSGFVPADTSYAFFIRHGNPNKLAILFDGGGACFDANTCIGSAITPGPATYSQIVDETTASLEFVDGLGDIDNPENPIADYTQVFIPYCTGDLHTGASTTEYLLQTGPVSLPWTINHRGADNVAFVMKELDRIYQTEVGRPPREVFLTGLSAGGYGVAYHAPAIIDRLPWYTKVRLVADAASGVITQNFYDLALAPNGNWAVWDNLPSVLQNAFSSGPDSIIVELYKALGRNYPRARFGQYTTAFDETQIAFYNIDKNINNPSLWLDPTELLIAGFEWTLKARTYQILTALQVWNYRYYLAEGSDHTVLADDKLYLETSGGGVALVDWLDDMLNRFWPWGSDWRSVSCAPDCLP